MKKNSVSKIFFCFFSILYPFVVFFALNNGVSLRVLSLFLFVFILCNFLLNRSKASLFLGATIVLATFFSNQSFFIYTYPVLMNGLFASIFILSLKTIPIIEIFARKMYKSLDENGIAYARKVTVAWCVFLLFNTFISFVTLFLPQQIWMIYNGFVSYLLIGAMMLAELLVRRKFRKV